MYLYRSSKNAGGIGRLRPGAGEWIGPGVIVGREGESFWVSRGGRCLLCAREHLRPAESEELGGAFQSKALKEDLMKLVDNIDQDEDNDDLFLDATDNVLPAKREGDEPGGMPEKRLRHKQYAVLRKKRTSEEREEGEAEEVEDEDIERRAGKYSREAYIVEDVEEQPERPIRMSKMEMKQLDKEVKWDEIPEEEKEAYKEAEKKQWDEHLHYEAVRPLTKEESLEVEKTVPKNRILTARFAYRDKNVAKRRLDSSIPLKAKARLCVGGHQDPDLRAGTLLTEAPTASKMSFTALLAMAGMHGWKLAAGDVEAAFLNGNEARRNLYFRQPARGLPGLERDVLVEVVKGVFGLSTSPRLWWEKLSKALLDLKINIDGDDLRLVQHDLDACLFILRDRGDLPCGALITHVDDILIAAMPNELKALQQALSAIFPISDWEEDAFDYIGSQVEQRDGKVMISQESYVDSRLETIEIPKGVVMDELADQVTKQDNQSTIGALSWLASQTRPDLQAGVSLAQRKQKSPTYADVKETNKVVKMAQAGKNQKLEYKPVARSFDDLAILVYHDAAWANATPDADDPEYQPDGPGIYSQLGHLVMLVDRRVLHGAPGPSMLVAWKSHACPRVCRSTFAAETMAALEGWEDALAFRAMVSGIFSPQGVFEGEARRLLPIVSITDCKSVYDAVHRIAGPRAPSEKRLIIDLAALRQIIAAEGAVWNGTLKGRKLLAWVPTTSQLADILTKVLFMSTDGGKQLNSRRFLFEFSDLRNRKLGCVNLPSHHDHSSSHMSCICTVMAFHGHKGTTALLSGGPRHTDLVLWQNRFHSSWQRGLGHLHLKEFTSI